MKISTAAANSTVQNAAIDKPLQADMPVSESVSNDSLSNENVAKLTKTRQVRAPRKSGKESLYALSVRIKSKLPISLILIVAILIGLTLIIFLYLPTSSQPSSETIGLPQTLRFSETTQELESIANQLISSNYRWDSTQVFKFISLWNRLTKPERLDLKETAWFTQLTFLLENKIKELGNLKSFTDSALVTSTNPVFTLALTLDINRSSYFYDNQRLQKQKYNKLISNVQTELSKMDSSQKSQSNDESANLLLNSELRKAFEATPQQTSKPDKIAVAKSKKTIPPPLAPTNTITGEKIRSLLSDYTKAYTTGNIELMRTLFISNESSIKSTLARDTLDWYNTLFINSTSRSVSFQNFKWQYAKKTAIGNGNYSAKITQLDSFSTQNMRAESVISLKMDKDEKLKFSQLVFHKQVNTSSIPNERSVFEVFIEHDPFVDETPNQASLNVKAKKLSNVNNISIDTPSTSELNDMINNFVTAYENGDINNLAKVLSRNVKTNDKSGFDEVIKDYIDLFSSSSQRQMGIRDLRWKFSEDHAKGTATLNASVTAINGKSVNQLNGKIQFIAKRIGKKVLITHFYHIAHSK